MVKSRYTVELTGPDGDSLSYPIPSVTEIIDAVLAKPQLAGWYYKTAVETFSAITRKHNIPEEGLTIPTVYSLMAQEPTDPRVIRDTSAKKGSKVHGYLPALAAGRRPKTCPKNLMDFWKERGWRASNILAVEQLVFNPERWYAGKLDLVYADDGVTTLADVKTGAERKDHDIQVELYGRATKLPIDRYSIITVPRDPEEPVTERIIERTRRLVQAADGILDVYDWLKGR